MDLLDQHGYSAKRRILHQTFLCTATVVNSAGDASMVITPKGSVVMAVNAEIAIFHNALDFEEKVPISTWVSAK